MAFFVGQRKKVKEALNVDLVSVFCKNGEAQSTGRIQYFTELPVVRVMRGCYAL